MRQSETRERMIGTAVLQFQRHGYRASSWRRLVEESDTPWGSVQHHFPGGKEELGEAAVTRAGDLVRQLLAAAIAEADNPADGVRSWFATSASMLGESGFAAGCPVAPVALEMGVESDRLAGACSAAFASWVETVAAPLREAGVEPAVADTLATAVISSFEGALVLARASRSTEPMIQVGETLAAAVERHL